jgi:hypothetical protein
MKKQLLNFGKALNKSEQKRINGGFAPCMTAEQCADIYNLTAFEPLSSSSFNCWNGICSFA